MIVLHAVFPIDPEQREEALDHVERLVEQSQAEPGVVDYRAAVDLEDENVVRFFEQYDDEAAFGAHAESDHLQAFMEADLLGGEPTVTRFDVESATELGD